MKLKNIFLFLIIVILFNKNSALAINDKYIVDHFYKNTNSITVIFKNGTKKIAYTNKDTIGHFTTNNKDSIFVAQSLLKKAGYYLSDINGNFNSQFNMAILEFQRDYNLPQNGFISLNDWFNLYNAALLLN